MKDFKDKVAVITGAASGIGWGLSERCAREGMHVVMADIEEDALQDSADKVKKTGASVLAVKTDVAKEADIQNLAEKTLATFGGIHLLANNAGVSSGQRIWMSTTADWEWILGVNLWATIHAVRIFVPTMLKQDTDCHIVNTASIEGFWSRATGGLYQVTKHALVVLSEVLYYQLKMETNKIGVSVLSPGAVDTNILDAGRNRPEELKNPGEQMPVMTPFMEERLEEVRRNFKEGMSPAEVAEHIFKAIRKGKFYIFTHPELKKYFKSRMKNILREKNPKSPFAEREALMFAEIKKMMNS